MAIKVNIDRSVWVKILLFFERGDAKTLPPRRYRLGEATIVASGVSYIVMAMEVSVNCSV